MMQPHASHATPTPYPPVHQLAGALGAYSPGTYARDASAPATGVHSAGTLAALLDSLRSETRLVEELAATMRRQRAAVAADDLQGVDDSVFATHRILATLGQARQRRRQLNRLLGADEEISVHRLDELLGVQMTDALRSARDGLQASAQGLAREVDVNRRVLRDAIASGESYVRALCSPSDPKRLYGAPGSDAAQAPPAGSFLLNRRV
jgi:hypothetical protein